MDRDTSFASSAMNSSSASRGTGTSAGKSSSSRGHGVATVDSTSQRCARGKQALRANLSVLSDEHVKLATSLIGVGQGHLFEHWAPPGIHDEDKQRLLTQLQALDANYPGGLRQYTLNARELLLKSKHKLSSLEGFTAEIPQGFSLQAGSKEMVEAEKQGYAVMQSCAFVLLAGGLGAHSQKYSQKVKGERLGYSGIKLALPAEITTGRCFLQYYIDALLALQSTCDMGPDQALPLIIMTSADTHLKTEDLLARNGHFGAKKSQIVLLKQEQVPALADFEGHFVLQEEGNQVLPAVLTKPHGHGDVHRLLYTSGTIRQLQEQGYKWLYFFQDTNALSFKAMIATLGLSAMHDLDMNTMAVPRKPGDACGALMRLRAAGGNSIVNNVEYSEIEAFLGGKAEPLDDTGDSAFPGNTNQFIVKILEYAKCMEASSGQVPEFVNPKYADDTRLVFSTPTRLECMMQDLPRLMTHSDAKVSYVKMERFFCYTPVKNGVKQGAVQADKGLPPMTPSSGEADLYTANRELLRLAGMQVADAPPMTLNGMSIMPGPRVVLAPSFALGVGDVLHKVRGGRMSSRSTLTVHGQDILIENLDLDGTLIVRAVPGAHVHLKGLVVKNRGWALETLKEGGRRAPEELRVRGYQLVKYEQRVLEFNEPGTYVVDQ